MPEVGAAGMLGMRAVFAGIGEVRFMSLNGMDLTRPMAPIRWSISASAACSPSNRSQPMLKRRYARVDAACSGEPAKSMTLAPP